MNISAAHSAPVTKAYTAPASYTPPPPKKEDASVSKPQPNEQGRGSIINTKA